MKALESIKSGSSYSMTNLLPENFRTQPEGTAVQLPLASISGQAPLSLDWSIHR